MPDVRMLTCEVRRNVHTSPSIQHASAASTPGTASHHGDLQTDSFFSPVASAAQVAGAVPPPSSGPPVGSLASPSIAHKVDVSTPGLVDGMQGSSGGSTSASFVPSYGVGADGMSMSMMSHDGTIRGEQAGEKTLFPTDTRVVRRIENAFPYRTNPSSARPSPLFNTIATYRQSTAITSPAAQLFPPLRPLHIPARPYRSETLHGFGRRITSRRTTRVSFAARARARGDAAGKESESVWICERCVSSQV